MARPISKFAAYGLMTFIASYAGALAGDDTLFERIWGWVANIPYSTWETAVTLTSFSAFFILLSRVAIAYRLWFLFCLFSVLLFTHLIAFFVPPFAFYLRWIVLPIGSLSGGVYLSRLIGTWWPLIITALFLVITYTLSGIYGNQCDNVECMFK